MLISAKKNIHNLVRLANRFLDESKISESDADEMISIAHEIGEKSLSGDFPSHDLMSGLVGVCKDQGISMAVIGGVAVAVHGLVRSTEDINILVSSMPDLSDVNYARKFGFYRARSSTGNAMVIDHRQSGYAELLRANNNIFQYALATAEPRNVLGQNVPVITPIAIIAMKVHAMVARPAREVKDTIDILAVAKVNAINLDSALHAIGSLLSQAELEKLQTILA